MDRTSPRPVPGHAALLLPEEDGSPALLAVADLHLGLGFTRAGGLGLAEAQARAMAEEILRLADSTGAGGVVVAGDAKHPIVGAPAPVGRILFDTFSTLLAEQLSVRLVPGNHDVGIARHLPREVVVGPAGGWRHGPFGIFHGHAWPPASVLRAPTLVAGHLHPGFRLAAGLPTGGGKQRSWVRTELAPPDPRRRRRRILSRELIVLPAFNPLSGIEALNRPAPRGGRSFLVHRFVAPGRSRAYLLDGTDLGELPSWSLPRGRPRAPRRP